MNRRHATVAGFVVMALLFSSGCALVRPGPDLVRQDAPHRAVGGQLARVRIPFVANQGQAPEHVKFYAPTFAGMVFVTTRGQLVYASPSRSEVKWLQQPALTEELIGGTTREVTGRGEGRAKVNVFHGNDPARWRSNVPTFDVVSLGDVYAGVEVTVRAAGNTVEKLFHVSPSADPASIRVKVRGGTLAVTPQGELEVAMSRGALKFTKPVAYQEMAAKRESVEVAYAVDGDVYGFRVGSYDRTRPLVIDPILTSTFLGGFASDGVDALALDAAGNVYVAGLTASPDFPGVGPGSADPAIGSFEAFVAKLDGNLTTIVAATFLGGSGDDHAFALALDGTGNVYVVGRTGSDDFPGIQRASAATSLGGFSDAFVVKLDGNLSAILAATYLGGSEVDAGHALALDGMGNVYVAGRTTSSDFPGVGPESADPTYVSFEAFVAKLDGDLTTILAATYLGGSSVEAAHAIALDAAGNVYAAGETTSSDFPGIGSAAADSTFADSEAFVVKLDGDLSTILAATFLGGSEFDSASALLLSGTGDVYVAGRTDSASFPGVGPGAADSTFAGNFGEFDEAFIAKLDANLSTILAATFLGGSGAESASALALDAMGNVYVTGFTGSFDFPGAAPGSADPVAVQFEGFVAKLNADLTAILAATFLGGSGHDFGSAIAVDPLGKIYVAGSTELSLFNGMNSSDFPGVGPGSADSTHGGFDEGFVAKLDGLLIPGYSVVQKLKGFVDSCVPCPPEVVQTLLHDIDQVTKQVLKGNERAAVSLLKVFVKKTERLMASRKLPGDVGRELIGLAQQAVAELGV